MLTLQKITPFLWYDSAAEEAASHYVKAFPDSRITSVERYPEGSPGPAGSVMTVSFDLAGQSFTALNGGPLFQPNESMSLMVTCEDQEEVDSLWTHLSEGGRTSACGWLKDKWGFSWQIVPRRFLEIMSTQDSATKARVFGAMLHMTKFDLARIEEAARG